MVIVTRGNAIAVGEKIDGFVRRSIELFAELTGQRSGRVGETF